MDGDSSIDELIIFIAGLKSTQSSEDSSIDKLRTHLMKIAALINYYSSYEDSSIDTLLIL